MKIQTPGNQRLSPTMRILHLLLFVLPAATRPLLGAESITLQETTTARVAGNYKGPGGCNGALLTFDFEFAGQTASSAVNGCCGYGYVGQASVINPVALGQVYSGYVQITAAPAEMCCAPGVLMDNVPSCLDLNVKLTPPCIDQYTKQPELVQFTAELRRNTNSLPVATWSIKDQAGNITSATPDAETGNYHLAADGMSQAIATVTNTTETPTFVFTGDSLGCTLTTDGVLTGRNSRFRG